MIDPTTLRYDANGLITAVVQDADSGAVRMVGMMDHEAVQRTIAVGLVTFWSRSRKQYWTKGETSGNTLAVVSMTADCDADVVLIMARAAGPTCHTGTETCFGPGHAVDVLAVLDATIEARRTSDATISYTASLLQSPLRRIAQKIGEEGVETALAITAQEDADVVAEAADLVYHLMVGLRARGLSWSLVQEELRRRHRNAT
jgi:phosphoribosyl-AMP cyclohydrolase / phosphoribosyl-ATP pyrophosphohydrolase